MPLLFASPLGLLTLQANDHGLTRISLAEGTINNGTPHPYEQATAEQLTEYFAGIRHTFTIPIAPFTGTPLQMNLWQALCTLPYGKTISYKELALSLGYDGAWRAVGAACARNPIPIVGACHRVVASSGALTGFAWGLAAKKQLLSLEQPR